jgi:flagellar protein FlaI
MESVQINVDEDKEEMVPRPDPPDELREDTMEILDNADPLFKQLRSQETSDIVSALTGVENEDDVTVSDDGSDESDAAAPLTSGSDDDDEEEAVEFGQFVPKAGAEASDES